MLDACCKVNEVPADLWQLGVLARSTRSRTRRDAPLSRKRKLIGRATRRDREAFAQLYAQYHPAVLHRLLILVGNRHEADDLTSETFLRAWNGISAMMRSWPASANR